MRRRVLDFVACGLVTFGVAGISLHSAIIAQESVKAGTEAKAEKGAKKTAKSGDRLPANYAKIGVSEEQRKKIYELQNKYDDQVAALQKQIADLREKEKADVEAILTPEQRTALKAANEESQKRAAEKKKAASKEKPSDKTEK